MPIRKKSGNLSYTPRSYFFFFLEKLKAFRIYFFSVWIIAWVLKDNVLLLPFDL